MQESTLIFISAFASLFLARKAAVRIGLVDKPNVRKNHKGNIPLVGGVSIYLALCVLYVIQADLLPHFFLYLECSTALLVVGILDDRFDMPVLPRIGLQACVAIAMMSAGVFISSLGNILFSGEVFLGTLGYIITLFAVLGSINAFNMVDGMDGLLSGLSFVTLSALVIAFYLGGNTELARWTLCFLAATLPYACFNSAKWLGRKFKVFMGDAGSTLVGFSIIWLLILATQGESSVMQPVTALWLIAIPLMDMAAVMIRRVARGRSPFKAGREHLHHILLHLGLTQRQTLGVIVAIASLLAMIGIICEHHHISESIMLGLFLLLFAGYVAATASSVTVMSWLRRVRVVDR
ncbi:UDP-N-acetylglucosamine--undecaprenyl-phosphate N-acetylglucosaminephosphotransferase [Pectobacterium sp. CFBP8739]|uniref:UDP-N-acetylglucosamine--undecaprenyl-phosphate N-acetylglucosaminephosphotransferase n=1 Tax=Pectobacterium sp. CFBP8739 TaxID=2748908 RepID=UPI0015DFDA68|nr:UDP-N-acetylglucosamine--undecaprenyl-phosphate N-acetylglucosaminephosphotransferase [Pectobacterium sp. CFBP8739]MBA0167772.1 UDP-N-acetylglucosamine--undecaprenyl-phosphate N-acetylglucosaminephosphotransferase [Pectobacterium sp. CFBP8739]